MSPDYLLRGDWRSMLVGRCLVIEEHAAQHFCYDYCKHRIQHSHSAVLAHMDQWLLQ